MTTFLDAIAETKRYNYEQDKKLVQVVSDIERTGIGVNINHVKDIEPAIIAKRDSVERTVYRLAGAKFNLNSPKQMRKYIYADAPVKRLTKKSKAPATDELTLSLLNTPLTKKIIEFREYDKLIGTYFAQFKRFAVNHGLLWRIHPNFNPNGARTGRFSSSTPNLQNIPRPGEGVLASARKFFIPTPGKVFVCVDFSQIELRIGAFYANDRRMLDVINSGGDLHTATTLEICMIPREHPEFEWYRQIGKTANFSAFYGAGARKFADTVLKETSKGGKKGIELSVEEARTYLERMKFRFNGIPKLFEKVHTIVRDHGGVTTLFGKFIRAEASASYMAVNYLIQGTCAQLLKNAMIECYDYLRGRETKMVATIHDEIIFEVPEKEMHIIPELKHIVETRKELDGVEPYVKLESDVKVARISWADKEKWKV